MTTDYEMAKRVHMALGGNGDDFRSPGHELLEEAHYAAWRSFQRLVAIGRELDKASRRDVAAEVVAAGEVSR
jgi:hypothetical protein